jgi:hypothetical protein
VRASELQRSETVPKLCCSLAPAFVEAADADPASYRSMPQNRFTCGLEDEDALMDVTRPMSNGVGSRFGNDLDRLAIASAQTTSLTVTATEQAGATRGDPYPGNARRTGPYAGKQKDQQKQLTNQPTTLQSDLM